jgi:hypothetical protein
MHIFLSIERAESYELFCICDESFAHIKTQRSLSSALAFCCLSLQAGIMEDLWARGRKLDTNRSAKLRQNVRSLCECVTLEYRTGMDFQGGGLHLKW